MRGSVVLDPRELLPRAAAVAVALLLGAAPSPAAAELASVSGIPAPANPDVLTAVTVGGPKQNVAYSLATGFPIWYRDTNGLALELCLDHQQIDANTGTPFLPCITAEPFPGAPISFPANFGAEAFYWSAVSFGTFTSTVSGVPVAGDALIVMAQEAGFTSGLAIDGNQAVFGRIRLRISVPVSGTYRVTHPYGRIDYVVVTPGLRAINQTQDVGNLLPPTPAGAPPKGDFTIAVGNGPDPATIVPPIGFPLIDAGIVSSQRTGIGPFLVADGVPPVTSVAGGTYLSNPGTELVPRLVPATPGPFGNTFRVELISTAVPDVEFNTSVATGGPNAFELTQFQIMGKVFDDGPNLRPVALDDVAGAAKGQPVLVDVAANDADDVVADENVHGINTLAIGLPSNDPNDLPGTILLTRPLTTASGGTVRRFTDFRTGQTRFLYTPAPGFSGEDTFQYVIQDTGGLISDPATVTVTVEDLAVARAEYRSRTGKWRVAGTTSDPTANSVSLFSGPRASLAGATSARGSASLRLAPDAIQFRVAVDPPPSTPVTQVFVHAGAQGQNGPPILRLYDVLQEAPFSGSKSGTVTDAQRIFGTAQAALGIDSFADVVDAILAGNAYVEIRTGGNPAGEIRGQLGSAAIGTAPVDEASGTWTFTGKSPASPGGVPASVDVRSANGVWELGTQLVVK